MEGNSDAPKPKGVKTGINVQGGTKARAQKGITIRNKERGEKLTKIRNRGNHVDPTAPHDHDAEADFESMQHIEDPDNPLSYNHLTLPELIPLHLLPVFVQMAQSDDEQHMLHGVVMIRKLLSVNENPPIQDVVDSGVLPYLVSLLSRDDWVELQFESAWAVSNIASGTQEHTHTVIRENAVPQLVRLLQSPSEDVREQATWAIGNIAGDSTDCRNYILRLGAMSLLVNAINLPVTKVTVTRNAVWALSNLCRSSPPPPLAIVSQALPVLSALLSHHDKEVATDACWAISYICDGPLDHIERVVQSSVLERVIAMLSAPSVSMQTPALRTIGNIVTGNDLQTQIIIDQGALNAFHFLLNHQRRAIKKEATWCLSNITAGSVEQVQAVMSADLYPVIIRLLDAPEYEVKKEAVWCIANTASGGTRMQMKYLMDIGVLPPLTRILSMFELKIVTIALETIENFLQLGAEEQRDNHLATNPTVDKILACGGCELIEALQENTSPEIYGQAQIIIQKYFQFTVGGVPAAAADQGGNDGDTEPDGSVYYNFKELEPAED